MNAAERRRRRRQEEAVRLRAKGYSLRSIARTLDCHHDTVWRDLRASDSAVRNQTDSVGNAASDSDTPDNVLKLQRKVG